eukprot:SM000025S08318  [mRNA]  locus=s25:28502:31803:+ [translate_table: standard]
MARPAAAAAATAAALAPCLAGRARLRGARRRRALAPPPHPAQGTAPRRPPAAASRPPADRADRPAPAAAPRDELLPASDSTTRPCRRWTGAPPPTASSPALTTATHTCGASEVARGRQQSCSFASTELLRTALGALENKFAVASGAKCVCICYYDKDNDWWASKQIRKKHNSTVTGVAWHPNTEVVATTSTDGRCRIFCASIRSVDESVQISESTKDSSFGEMLLEVDGACGWTFGVSWSPSGSQLAYAGQDSSINFVSGIGPSAVTQRLSLRGLPLLKVNVYLYNAFLVIYLSETAAVGVGHDCCPLLFLADDTGSWTFAGSIDEATKPTASSRETSRHEYEASQGASVKMATNEPTQHSKCITALPRMIVGLVEAVDTNDCGRDGS